MQHEKVWATRAGKCIKKRNGQAADENAGDRRDNQRRKDNNRRKGQEERKGKQEEKKSN